MTEQPESPGQSTRPDGPSPAPPHDLGFLAIVALVIVISVWLLLMPLVPAITSTTLHRFHLRTQSFPAWAIQFPIPAMYNFANRYEVMDGPHGEADPTEVRYANHFPARLLTFADARYKYLRQREDRWYTIESSYRGLTLQSRFHAKLKDRGRGFELIRLPSPDVIEARP